MTAAIHFVQPFSGQSGRIIDSLTGSGLPAGYEYATVPQSTPTTDRCGVSPLLPLDILASGLGIAKITVDEAGTQRFSPPVVESTAAQRVTDAILDAMNLEQIDVSLSEQRSGSILSPQAMNRLGREGIRALVEAGFIVRTPSFGELHDGSGRCSVFPNPSADFLHKLGELCGVAVNDKRGLASHETSGIAMSSPLLDEPFWGAAPRAV